MFGERCTLCGGKLDGNQVCVECGLDNSRSEKHYKINQSRCDGQPLTHVHEESRRTGSQMRTEPSKKRQRNTAQNAAGYEPTYNTYRETEKRARKKKTGRILMMIIALIVIFNIALPLLGNLLFQIDTDEFPGESFSLDLDGDYEVDTEYDPYQNVTRALPDSGEVYESRLGQGEYVGGVHIPEGTYTVTSEEEGFVSVYVEDAENEIWLYESLDSETPVLEEVCVYQGAVVTVSGDTFAVFSTENAQTDTMVGEANPLTEEIRLDGGKAYTAGKDFPAGVYDVSAVSGYGGPALTVYDSQGGELDFRGIWLSDSEDAEKEYRNLVIPEGALLTAKDYETLEILLKPSETIRDTDYQGYYEWH